MSAAICSNMTPEEERRAAEFEQGWSSEKIAAATVRLGPEAQSVLPAYLSETFHQRAQDEGSSDLSLPCTVVASYSVTA